MIMKKSIGVFDSGMGGVTLLAELLRALPREHFIYLGDSLNAPYGEKTPEEVTALTEKAVEALLEKGVKMVVIACNTATSAAARRVREKYDIPIIGMEPAIKPALLSNKGGQIAVMATEMTLKLDKFNFLIERFKGKGKILKIPAPKLVKLVEEGITEGPLVQDYLKTLFMAYDLEKIESVVLGCTHFLYCEPSIQSFFNHGVKIFDGHQGTVNHVIDLLEAYDLLEARGPGGYEIINSKSEAMKKQSRILLDHYLAMKR